MEEVLKSLYAARNVLARRSNGIWEILLSSEQEAKQLAESILMAKSERLQTEYMGTRKTRLTVHSVPVDINEDRMGAFFTKNGQVNEDSAVIRISSISTVYIVL